MTEQKQINRPTHIIWQVIGEGEEAFWNRLGAGWANSDGQGISLRFDAYPVVGRTVIRVNKEKSEDGASNTVQE